MMDMVVKDTEDMAMMDTEDITVVMDILMMLIDQVPKKRTISSRWTNRQKEIIILSPKIPQVVRFIWIHF